MKRDGGVFCARKGEAYAGTRPRKRMSAAKRQFTKLLEEAAERAAKAAQEQTSVQSGADQCE